MNHGANGMRVVLRKQRRVVLRKVRESAMNHGAKGKVNPVAKGTLAARYVSCASKSEEEGRPRLCNGAVHCTGSDASVLAGTRPGWKTAGFGRIEGCTL